MNDDMLDRILAAEEELIPSSGFAASVMNRIYQEAAAPQPIPFPWKRAVFGIVPACCGLGWGAVELTRLAVAAVHDAQPMALQVPETLLGLMPNLGWTALALGVSLVAWLAAHRLAGDSRLL